MHFPHSILFREGILRYAVLLFRHVPKKICRKQVITDTQRSWRKSRVIFCICYFSDFTIYTRQNKWIMFMNRTCLLYNWYHIKRFFKISKINQKFCAKMLSNKWSWFFFLANVTSSNADIYMYSITICWPSSKH